jgi:membrane associated rhomboid family serine protease
MAREVEVEIVTPNQRRSPGSSVVRPGCGILFAMVLLAWGVELTDTVLRVFGYSLDIFGIFPRKFYGLLGILFAPLLHGGWFHLMSNTVAFLGLGFAMMLAEKERFLVTTFLLVFWSGLGTWLIGGSGTVHIGASGMIYGYFGYLLARAWTERRALWIVGGIVVAILYGSMLWGVVPSHRGISWEAHLCGLIAGIVLGRQHGLTSAGRGPR